MKQKELSILLRAVVALAAVAAAVCFAVFAVVTVQAVVAGNWQALPLAGILIMFIPLFLAMMDLWKIFTEIGRDNSFCLENALRLRRISFYALFDTVLLLAGVILALILRWNPYALIFLSLMGLAATVACAALSHLTRKAALLKDENDLTI